MAVSEKPSKGAEKILLAQIKQEFAAPAEAIEQYIDLVEEFGVKNNLDISSEINQIKEAEDKLLSQYEDAFRENTAADKQAKTSQEYSELRHNLRTPLNAIIGYSEILMEDFEDFGKPVQCLMAGVITALLFALCRLRARTLV